jgi:hypothetical protein
MAWKEKLAIAKEVIQTISTASSVMVATSLILDILKYIDIVNKHFLPVPILVVILYIVLKFLPTGISQIKKELKQSINKDTFSESEMKELLELKQIIEQKTQVEVMANEPIVFVDDNGNEYVQRNHARISIPPHISPREEL